MSSLTDPSVGKEMVQDTGKQAFSSAAEENACLIKNGAGEGNRTLVTSLEGWRSTIELHPHIWSEQQDLNLRPPGPEPGALPNCAMPRQRSKLYQFLYTLSTGDGGILRYLWDYKII